MAQASWPAFAAAVKQLCDRETPVWNPATRRLQVGVCTCARVFAHANALALALDVHPWGGLTVSTPRLPDSSFRYLLPPAALASS